jgi:hypothetical protein
MFKRRILMKIKRTRLVIMSFIAGLTVLAGLTVPALANSPKSVPETINGLPVIYVEKHENTASLADGRRVFIVLDNISSSYEDPHKLFSSKIEELKSILGDGDSIRVVGGPNASKEKYLQAHEKKEAFFQEYGDTLVPPRPVVESPEFELYPMATTSDHTFAIVANMDEDHSITVKGIRSEMAGITVGDDQTSYSFFITNGETDDDYFLQSGQRYNLNGTGEHIYYVNDGHGYVVYDEYSMDYDNTHDYRYEIKNVASGYWLLNVTDLDTSDYEYYIENTGSGVELVATKSTSVFFENYNSNANWFYGFPYYVSAHDARIYNGYNWVDWSYEQISICGGVSQCGWNNDGKISGELVDDETALWDLTELLLANTTY